MSTILQLTVEEYGRMVEKGAFDGLGKKIELIRGEIRSMNPAGPIHDDLVAYLIEWSIQAKDHQSMRLRVQTGLELADQQSRPEPDLLWVRAGRFRERHPTAVDVKLAIEVADSSLPWDLSEKASLYAEAGIAEYWVVDARGSCVHVCRDPFAGQYRQRLIASKGDLLSPLVACHRPLDVSDLFR